MSDPFSIIFIFMGIIAIGAIVFGVWVVAAIIRLVIRVFTGLFTWNPAPDRNLGDPTRICPRSGCHAVNPSSARFCRRCGRELLRSEMSFRAATW